MKGRSMRVDRAVNGTVQTPVAHRGAAIRQRSGPILQERSARRRSDAAQQNEYQHDDQNGADNTARPVAPAPAVGPGRKRADQHEDENDQKKRTDGHVLSPEDVPPG